MKNTVTEEKNKKRADLAQISHRELKSKLSTTGMSLPNFLEEVYKEVDSNADSGELYDHGVRAKKNLARNSEVSALYLFYYEHKHGNSIVINKSCKEAAYELYIEIITRVSSTPLSEDLGCDTAALDSVYSLFDSWRNICRKYGSDGVCFLNHSKLFFDNVVRPFTTRWHNNLNESQSDRRFRNELLDLQKATNEYIKKLEIDFDVYPANKQRQSDA